MDHCAISLDLFPISEYMSELKTLSTLNPQAVLKSYPEIRINPESGPKPVPRRNPGSEP